MRAVGIILAGGNSFRMKELSNKRAIAAMPIAGSFRSIDFALSNMSNSHIQLYGSLHCRLSDSGGHGGHEFLFIPGIWRGSEKGTPVLYHLF